MFSFTFFFFLVFRAFNVIIFAIFRKFSVFLIFVLLFNLSLVFQQEWEGLSRLLLILFANLFYMYIFMTIYWVSPSYFVRFWFVSHIHHFRKSRRNKMVSRKQSWDCQEILVHIFKSRVALLFSVHYRRKLEALCLKP